MTIRTRLTLYYGLAYVAIAIVAGSIVYMQSGRDFRTAIDDTLRVLALDVADDRTRHSGVGLTAHDPQHRGNFVIVYGPNGTMVDRTPDAPPIVQPPAPSASTVTIGRMAFAVYAVPSDTGEIVVAGRSLAYLATAREALIQNLILAGVLTGLAALAGGWWLAGRALAPLRGFAAELEAIDVGDLGRRVGQPRELDEAGRLARGLNAMLARIDDGMHRQQAFVAAASHDLRTPIAALRTELELAERGRLTRESLLAAIQAAHGDAVRLGELANELLQLAEFEPGGRPLTRVAVPVADLLDIAIRDVLPLASERSIEVEVAAAPTSVEVDRQRIEQAVRNLVANALRAAPPRTAVLVVAAIRAPDPERSGNRRSILEVTVRDHGGGVDPDVREALFLPFARSNASQDGTGLGLATAAAAVRAHGGEIGYRDAPGGGAEFWFRVPA